MIIELCRGPREVINNQLVNIWSCVYVCDANVCVSVCVYVRVRGCVSDPRCPARHPFINSIPISCYKELLAQITNYFIL
jgi:hypothetical protein